MERHSELLTQLDRQPELQRKPQLLLLAALLASLPFAAPNARIVRDMFGIADFITLLTIPFATAIVVLSAALIASSQQSSASSTFSRRIGIAAAVVYVASLAALYGVLLIDATSPLLLGGIGVCMAAAFVPLVAGWIKLYETDMRNIMFYGSLCLVATALVAWALSLVPPLWFAVCNVALAIAGCMPILFESAQDKNADEALGEVRSSHVSRGMFGDFLSLIWLPFLGLLVCVFMSCASEFVLAGETLRSEFIGTLVAATIALVVCLVPHRTPTNMVVEFLVAPVLIAISIVLGSFQPGDLPFFIGASLVYAPLMFMALFGITLLEAVIEAGEFGPRYVMGVALGAIAIVILLGMTASLVIPSDTLSPYMLVLAYIYFGIVFVHIGRTAWRYMSRTVDEEESRIDAATVSTAEGAEARWRAEVAELADAHNLTARERELLMYMSRGYGSGYISKTLFISDNTARTHIRNIYRKLGVHSREELIALFANND